MAGPNADPNIKPSDGSGIAVNTRPAGEAQSSANSVDTTVGGGKSSTKGKSFSITPKETAISELNQMIFGMFGFYPSAAVAEKYYKALHAREKQYASNSSSKGSDSYTSARTSDSSGNSVAKYSQGSSDSRTSTDFAFNKQLFLNDYATGLAKTYIAKGKTFGGTARDNYNDIASYARDMGVSISESTLIDNTINSIIGKSDVKKTKADILATASRFYPAIADLLKSDPTKSIREHIGGYIETAATVLDLDPGNISLQDKAMQKLLTYTDDKGNHMLKSKSGFMSDLRDDSRFKYSTYAKNEAGELGDALASAMGFGGVA